MSHRIRAALALSALLISANASAAFIAFTPFSNSGQVGDIVEIALSGQDFGSGTSGGDFQIQWNPIHLSFVSFTVASNPVIFDTVSINDGNVANGELTRVDLFKSSTGTVTDFAIGTLRMQLLPGITNVQGTTIQSFRSLVGWYESDAITEIDVLYGAANVSAVPAPPAAWLLLTGIAGLVARRLGKA